MGEGVPPKPQIHCQQTFCMQTSSSFLGPLQWLVGWGGLSCIEEVLQCCFSSLSYSARFKAIVIIDLGNLARVPNWSRMKKGETEKWLIKDHFMHDAASLCNGDGSSNSNRYFLDDRTSPCFSHGLVYCSEQAILLCTSRQDFLSIAGTPVSTTPWR